MSPVPDITKAASISFIWIKFLTFPHYHKCSIFRSVQRRGICHIIWFISYATYGSRVNLSLVNDRPSDSGKDQTQTKFQSRDVWMLMKLLFITSQLLVRSDALQVEQLNLLHWYHRRYQTNWNYIDVKILREFYLEIIIIISFSNNLSVIYRSVTGLSRFDRSLALFGRANPKITSQSLCQILFLCLMHSLSQE